MIDLAPRAYLATRLATGSSTGLIVDVGAAAGDFAVEMQALRPGSPLLLVEPDPGSAAGLHKRFAGQQGVTIATCALSDRPGSSSLHRYAESTQNSLLTQVGATPVDTVTVPVETLDRLLARFPHLPAPGLIKIDTQGRDLLVLRGAIGTLRAHRPLLQVEVIFADLYQHQGTPGELFALLTGEGYQLADMVMPHVDDNGRLAYADWIFTPDRPSPTAGPFACRDAALLAAQASIYETAAAERLALIERLDRECRQRQDLIDTLRTGATT